jgi:hypothetical protein
MKILDAPKVSKNFEIKYIQLYRAGISPGKSVNQN